MLSAYIPGIFKGSQGETNPSGVWRRGEIGKG